MAFSVWWRPSFSVLAWVLLLLFWVGVAVETYAFDPCNLSAGFCWVGDQGCTVSGPGVPCIECNSGAGYWDVGLGGCVYDGVTPPTSGPTVTQQAVLTETNCDDKDECEEGGVCKFSQKGVLCTECNSRGYRLRNGTCVCVSASFDGNAACTSRFDITQTPTTLTTRFDRVFCDAHNNELMGCYAPAKPCKYGDANCGSVPSECCSPLYGPKPGRFTSDAIPREECNTFGGIDPNQAFGVEADLSFYTCNGHGTFNRTSYNCDCDDGWARVLLGYDVLGRPAYGCSECADNFGPMPGHANALPPFCVKPYLPNTQGVLDECSGNGVFSPVTKECVCFSNVTHGFWQAVPVFGFMTCLECQFGYGPRGKCDLPNNATRAPTLRPTTQAPSKSPTQVYSPCRPCFGQTIGRATLDFQQQYRALTLPADLNSTCCTYTALTLAANQTQALVQGPGTCLDLPVTKYSLGWSLCAQLTNCTAFSIDVEDANTELYKYQFTDAPGELDVIDNPTSLSSYACDQA